MKSETNLFEIINSSYNVVSRGLNKHGIYYAFIEKRINKSGNFFIRDEHGLDMKFNEFLEFYPI